MLYRILIVIPTLAIAFCYSAFGGRAMGLNKNMGNDIDNKRDSIYLSVECADSVRCNGKTSSIKTIKPLKLPKEVKSIVHDLQFIKGGSIDIGNASQIVQTVNDTGLIIDLSTHKATVDCFLMGKHEVTNEQYREFTKWVKDSIVRSFLAVNDKSYYSESETKKLNWDKEIDWQDNDLIKEFFTGNSFNASKLIYHAEKNEKLLFNLNVYPDTTCWIKDFSYSYNEPMVNMYNWHPAYDHYPVVGVSWQQSNAYCHWKSVRLCKLLAKNGINGTEMLSFCLPSEDEWEYAAIAERKKETNYKIDRRIFPWEGYKLTSAKGEYLANFGKMEDVNYYVSKWYTDDRGFFSLFVAAYTPNDFGLFDMAGNVSEWVMDKPSVEYDFNIDIVEIDNLSTIYEKISDTSVFMLPYENTYSPDMKKKIKVKTAEVLLNNYTILKNNDSERIVKGGSWADPPVYLMCANKEAVAEEQKSCRIGFRVKLSITDELLPYFITKEDMK